MRPNSPFGSEMFSRTERARKAGVGERPDTVLVVRSTGESLQGAEADMPPPDPVT